MIKQKNLLFVFLLFLNTNICFCMDLIYIPGKLTLKQLCQPDDPALTKKRSQCTSFKKLLKTFPNNIVVQNTRPKDLPGVCYNVAMKKSLGLSTEQFQHIQKHMVGALDWIAIIDMPFKFFQQQEFPQRGSLAVYSRNKRIQHFGIIKENGRIESRLGTISQIIEHDYWDIYDHYGKMLSFWKLKEEYHGQNGKKKLFDEIMHIIEESNIMKQLLYDAHKLLFAFAENKNTNANFSICPLLPGKDFYDLLDTVMGLDINKSNENGETALMLAAKTGHYPIVNWLLKYNANTKLKNKDNLTAFDLAHKNKHFTITDLLFFSRKASYHKI